MNIKRYDSLVEECEMGIVGHKVFVRLKDIPMYLSKKTRDSIRNRYSHSVEVGLSTEYMINHISRRLGDDVDLNFFKVAKIVGLLHDIGHTAYSHDGEVILDQMLQKASSSFEKPLRFNANLNNFRRIEKYGLYDILPQDIKEYALASLLKRSKELKEYPEYIFLKTYQENAMKLEEEYLSSKGFKISNQTGKTILCQAMDLADENRYRVTDIIDALNIYSKGKLREILFRMIKSEVRIKELRKLVNIKTIEFDDMDIVHFEKLKIRDLLLLLLERSSNAKTEFQNVMNSISMAFNRNFKLEEDGRLVAVDQGIEALRNDFQRLAAKYIWGSKKVEKIKEPYKHYFSTVADYFIHHKFDMDLIDSNSYKQSLIALRQEDVDTEDVRKEELILIRNFLGGLTNLKIIELYKKIMLVKFEAKLGYKLDKRDTLIEKNSVKTLKQKLDKYHKKLIKKG
ncbi:MAG: HD domain-containing protein [Campylobacterales bacterium]|nr:HD domain-containing protein [Campylobacterales bacterium]